ncbi:hypothetical protein ACT3RM_17730, partial [Pseudoalteromonas sp. AOP7-A1-14]|uniref:hypothetical protein n=2 Tax=unclassified Pseudoalteromonas TaxID=194690 RepID=UPI00402B083A
TVGKAMLNLASAVILTLANLIYAAIIYLSLHGWLVVHEPSGMQLLMHLVVTAPLVLITTIWFFYLSGQKKCSTIFWKLNLVGILIPVMSVQTGVTHYHFDKVGLATSVLVAVGIFILFISAVRQNAHS